jgi:hypothetical protein
MSSPNKDLDKIAGFFSKLVIGLMDGDGMNVNLIEVPGVIAAGKRIGKEGKEVALETLRRIETAHPEIWDLLLASSSEIVKERIRKALVPRKDIDTTMEK